MGILDWGKSNLKTIQKLTTQVTCLQQALLTTEAELQQANDRIRTLENHQINTSTTDTSRKLIFYDLIEAQYRLLDQAKKDIANAK